MQAPIDYLIVGAGSAGCVLAARLSEDPACRVTLIEAGNTADPRLAPVPGAAPRLQNTRADWGYLTVPQRELFGRRIGYPRGRVLGGTSVLNYMMYMRGNAGDYDGWAQQGNAGWSYAEVLPYFRKAESNADIDDEFHGRDGPLGVERSRVTLPLYDLFFEAAHELGLPYNPDVNGASQFGAGPFQSTRRAGRRSSTAEAYLDPVRTRPNLRVITEATVTGIRIEHGRAVGIDFLEGGRESRTLRADREVVLAAGAIGSPQLLMLSGVGPAEHLREHGIGVRLDLPAVGQNLEDHLGIGALSVPVKDPRSVYGALPGGFDEALVEFHRSGGGPLATLHVDAGAFYSVDPGTAWPQCQAVLLPGIAEFNRVDGAPDVGRFMLGGWPCRSKSRGSVTLASANPLDAPLIDPNYLSEPDDLRVTLAQKAFTREVLNARAFDGIRASRARPEFASDAEAVQHVRRFASTIWHPTSTCRMGKDADSVVGPDLRVHGIDGLTICDASVMPTMVSGNTNAPTIMIAEKGADLIRARSLR
jgi:choline dehydrogenase